MFIVLNHLLRSIRNSDDSYNLIITDEDEFIETDENELIMADDESDQGT